MSMTELGVYGEEITGSPAATVNTEDKGNHNYQVNVGLENIYNKYRNTVVEYTYDPSQITLNTDSAAANDCLLYTSKRNGWSTRGTTTPLPDYAIWIPSEKKWRISLRAVTLVSVPWS